MAIIYGRDFLFGDTFRASDYQLYPASFSITANDEEETGIGIETTEEYISDNPIPVYIGQKYSDKLKPTICLTKDSCITDDEYFSEHDCRAILRQLIGQRGYQWMKLVSDEPDEDLWYRSRIVSVKYQRVNGFVAGIILDMECDSQFAWSTEKNITVDALANTPFYIYTQTDDLYNYIKPFVTIVPKVNGNLSLVNRSDNNWAVTLTGVRNGETITYDTKNQVIDGSRNASGQAVTKFLDYSNCHFPRMVDGKNEYVSNIAARYTFTFRTPRRVAFAKM